MRERRGAYRALVGNLRKGTTWEYSDLDERIILKWIFERWVGEGMDCIDLSIWLRIGTGGILL
jgi:hypothetical protein